MANSASNAASRFLTFRVGEQLYALRSELLSEVIRVPGVARVPQAPAALLGIANLRGSVLPVASLRSLLGKKAAPDLPGERAIVLDLGAPVAVVVDAVESLETAEDSQIETRQKELGAEGGEKLSGAFAVGAQKRVAKILDIKALLETAFANRARAQGNRRGTGARAERSVAVAAASRETLVTFEVAGQEFALPIDNVREILPSPAEITPLARAENMVLGIISVRDELLPLLSLRALLGFGAGVDGEGREKVVVMNLGGARVGLMADRARAIVAAEADRVDPVPAVLTARVRGEAQIKAVYRGEGGKRLISILSPQQLFREDVMQRLAAHPQNDSPSRDTPATLAQEQIFLVFRLGDDEFGLPIDAVVEVAQVPAQVTRVPRTPKFLEGVINLRGEVLPVVDQRRRFDMPTLAGQEGRRLVVVRTERHRAGLIVDSVSDVLRTRADRIEPPPELTDATSRLVRGVVNLEEKQRIVLLLDPTELLTRAEQGLLDTFQAESKKQS